MKTTLNKIRSHSPCEDGWKKLLKHLGKTAPDDEPLHLLTILDSNGLRDTIWCLRAVEGFEREIRLFAVFCARRGQHLMRDPRSIAALDVAERFAKGLATREDLAEAAAEARAAAAEAWAEAWAAARAEAWAEARAEARAAWAAAAAEARAAAAAADWAGDAAWDAEQQAQEAELRRVLVRLTDTTS